MSNEYNNLKEFEGFAIDGEKRVLWYENEPVDLPVKAVELLNVLIENRGEVVSKEELLEKVWNDSFVEEGVLPQNVYLLRKLFKEKGLDSKLIKTVPRRGYRFTGELTETDEEEITIERKSFERTFIAETEIDDENSAEVFDGKVINAEEIIPAQVPGKVSNKKHNFINLSAFSGGQSMGGLRPPPTLVSELAKSPTSRPKHL